MSNFQRERIALAERLRELRRDARLTGRQLAASLLWHPSKISKIEAAKQTPSHADIEAWATGCGAPAEVANLIAAVRSLESHYREYRRQFRAGMAPLQREIVAQYAELDVLRSFSPVFVPGILQTPNYARDRFVEAMRYSNAIDDVDDAVAERMARQKFLYRAEKRFHLVVTEASLRYRLCPHTVMVGQLDRLVSVTTIQNVHFGIIPFDTEYTASPSHSFTVYDTLPSAGRSNRVGLSW